MILLNRQLVYYDTGESWFKPGESVYINKACEQASPHLHAHDFIEIAYVASGTGIHRIGENEYAVSKGNLCIIDYNVPHEFRSYPDSSHAPLYVYNCVFKPEFIDYSLINCKDFSSVSHHFLFRSLFPEENDWAADIYLTDTENSGIEDIYERMYKEYQIKEPGYAEMLRVYIVELLIKIFRLHQNKNRIETNRRQIIDNIIQYMKANYMQELKLEDLSMMAFLSRNYFCKLFKDCTGMTVFEYAQKIRIEQACKLLKTTNKKIVDIAADVGYSDMKFFNHIFKKITGTTPRDFKKQGK